MKKLLFTGFMAMIMAIPTFARADTCPDLTTIIGVNETGTDYAAINNSGLDWNNNASTYGLTSSDKNAFVTDYGNKGIVRGHSRCSTQSGTGILNGASGPNDVTTHKTLTDETGTGQYCYCQLDSYTPKDGSPMSLSAPWVFYYGYDGAGNCAGNCAIICASHLQSAGNPDDLAFRAAVFNSVSCPAQSGSNQQSGGGQYCCRRE